MGKVLALCTVFGVVVGILFGAIIGNFTTPSKHTLEIIALPGQLFMQALNCLVLPLVASTMVCSLSGLPLRSLGRTGVLLMAYIVCTLLLAAVTGLFFVNVIQPGTHHSFSPSASLPTPATGVPEPPDALSSILNLVRSFIPPNLVDAASGVAGGKVNLIGIMVFGLWLGATASSIGEPAQPIITLCQSVSTCMMAMVQVLLTATPIGVASLIAHRFASLGSSAAATLTATALYIVTVISGLLVHNLLILPLVYFVITKRNPYRVLQGMSQACITIIGTDSSMATLPVTIQCCEAMGVGERMCGFVLPIGATLNMNGTALYEATAAVFIAQLSGRSLSVGESCTVVITAILAAMGAAAIPSAGLVTLLMVLQSVGLPADTLPILLSVDWLLDRCRSIVNICGDAFAAMILQQIAPLPAHWEVVRAEEDSQRTPQEYPLL